MCIDNITNCADSAIIGKRLHARMFCIYIQNVLEDYDDIVVTAGTGGTAADIAIANYLTGSKLK